jgi:hypothetical protein
MLLHVGTQLRVDCCPVVQPYSATEDMFGLQAHCVQMAMQQSHHRSRRKRPCALAVYTGKFAAAADCCRVVH